MRRLAWLVCLVVLGCGKKPADVTPTQADTVASTRAGTDDEQQKAQLAAQPVGPKMPASMDLNLEQRHPNGVVLWIRRVAFTPTYIQVSIEAVNGHPSDVHLATVGSDAMKLVDDKDNVYRFRPSKVNKDLTVKTGASLKGDIIFPGSLDARATKLTFINNNGEYRDSEHTTYPAFEIAIPIQR